MCACVPPSHVLSLMCLVPSPSLFAAAAAGAVGGMRACVCARARCRHAPHGRPVGWSVGRSCPLPAILRCAACRHTCMLLRWTTRHQLPRSLPTALYRHPPCWAPRVLPPSARARAPRCAFIPALCPCCLAPLLASCPRSSTPRRASARRARYCACLRPCASACVPTRDAHAPRRPPSLCARAQRCAFVCLAGVANHNIITLTRYCFCMALEGVTAPTAASTAPPAGRRTWTATRGRRGGYDGPGRRR